MKIGHTQELAKVELYREDKGTDKLSKVNESLKKAETYQTMLKKIIPIYFKEEYETLQQLQSKKSNVE